MARLLYASSATGRRGVFTDRAPSAATATLRWRRRVRSKVLLVSSNTRGRSNSTWPTGSARLAVTRCPKKSMSKMTTTGAGARRGPSTSGRPANGAKNSPSKTPSTAVAVPETPSPYLLVPATISRSLSKSSTVKNSIH